MRRQVHLRAVQIEPLRHLYLRAHDVDPGNHLRDRVFHLHARIHLDKEPFVSFRIHQKLDRPGIVIFRFTRQLHRCIGKLRTNLLGKPYCRRDLDDLLMTPLHRAIALIQVQDIALLVPDYLDLDVFRSPDIALEEHCGVAERRHRFLARLLQPRLELRRRVDDPHAAAAASECSFDDQRKTDRRAIASASSLDGIDRLLRSGNYRNIRLLGQLSGCGFIAQ